MWHRIWFRAALIHVIVFSAATLVANADSTIILWQLPPSSHIYYSLRYGSGGSALFVGGTFSVSTEHVLIKKFDALTGDELASTTENARYFFGANEIALSPDESRIITANYLTVCDNQWPPFCEGGFLQYDGEQLTLLPLPPDSKDANYTVDYAPDGQLIALGGSWYHFAGYPEDNIRLVRAADLVIERRLPGHMRGPNDGGTYRLRFSPDGRLLASCGADSYVKIWRVADGELLRSFNFDDAYKVDSVAFSPDGQFVAAGRPNEYPRVKVWRIDTGKLVRTWDVSPDYTRANFIKVTWTPDGTHVVAGITFEPGFGPNKIQFWKFLTGDLVQEYTTQVSNELYDIVFSPDNSFFAYAEGIQVTVAFNPVATPTPTASPTPTATATATATATPTATPKPRPTPAPRP